MEEIQIRPYNHGEDVAVVCDNFASSSRSTFPFTLIRKSAAAEAMRRLLEGTRLRVAVATCEGVVIGWAARYEGALLYAYTKHDYRRRGICRALLSDLGLILDDLEVIVWTRGAAKVAASHGRVRAGIAEGLL